MILTIVQVIMFKNKPFKFELNKTILLSIYSDLNSDENEKLMDTCIEHVQNIGTDMSFLNTM